MAKKPKKKRLRPAGAKRNLAKIPRGAVRRMPPKAKPASDGVDVETDSARALLGQEKPVIPIATAAPVQPHARLAVANWQPDPAPTDPKAPKKEDAS